MIKVRILDRCEFCDGEAYVFDHEDVDIHGEAYDRYRPCEMCHGSGNLAKWIGLRELFDLLERAIAMEHRGIAVGCSEMLCVTSARPAAQNGSLPPTELAPIRRRYARRQQRVPPLCRL